MLHASRGISSFLSTEKLVSECDPRLISEFWQNLFRVLVTKLNISIYKCSPRNGRANPSFEQVIRCYVHPLHDDWVNHLVNPDFEFNAATPTATTMSPLKVTFGFEPVSYVLAVMLQDTEPTRILPGHVHYIQEVHRFAQDCVRAAQSRMTTMANRKRLPAPFKVGDTVKLKAHHLKFLQQPCAKLFIYYVAATLDLCKVPRLRPRQP